MKYDIFADANFRGKEEMDNSRNLRCQLIVHKYESPYIVRTTGAVPFTANTTTISSDLIWQSEAHMC